MNLNNFLVQIVEIFITFKFVDVEKIFKFNKSS